ncbi:MAG: type IV pilin N-terminal domain-containing protein [Candidatus Thermoplasmatota archaeon]|nr:type IV pilin N-terminal domain-containing protein [Candidatus Thermoplasmatota archaeon]
MNTKKMAKRLKDSGVSPVIATILMVAITVVLAAVLYVMVSGFTHSPGTANSAGLTEAAGSGGSYTVTISSVSASNIPVANLKIVISGATITTLDGTYANNSDANGLWSTAGSTSTGAPGVQFTIISGNSATYLSAGDYLTLTLPTGAASDGFGGATVTLYNGNANLGSVTL